MNSPGKAFGIGELYFQHEFRVVDGPPVGERRRNNRPNFSLIAYSSQQFRKSEIDGTWKSRTMKTTSYAFIVGYLGYACFSSESATLPITACTTDATDATVRDQEEKIEAVSMTEQVMDPDIKITDVPDLVESTEDWDANWDANKVIRDVAYYIRAHKFQDFDRRYYRRLEDSPSKLYEEFPKPPLRSLHWEVRRHCDASFVECLKYLERTVKLTALRREDDTATIMKEQKWNLANNTKQLKSVRKECRMAQRRDNLTMVPFQGPIERFQWRTTVSYYMCWYTMLGVPELSIFGESCDNHANCQIEHGADNGDPRADDTKPYACALYSFCPDHCCPMRYIRYTTDCYDTPLNPCYAENSPTRRECTLNREENRDFLDLTTNRINISCQCQARGYEWSSRFGICVDTNECTSGKHHCAWKDGQVCINLPGSYDCACRFGYVYDSKEKSCVVDSVTEEVLASSKPRTKLAKTKSVIETIVQTVTRYDESKLHPMRTGNYYERQLVCWYYQRKDPSV
ncbi:uncharacterized protein LOC143152600 [Ptiloglossa arizonensis]|uniref:uncharacterized protein LOC143152600 n=1 Tax=Ptiloglossa arizonensis TaxID=3350558 RepID=UPI003FA14F4B